MNTLPEPAGTEVLDRIRANRVRKMRALVEVLVDATATMTDQDVRLLRLVGQDVRDLVAQQAGVYTPSDTTWVMTVDALLRRRATVRLIGERLKASIARPMACADVKW